MYVSILGNHPIAGANATITVKIGEKLPENFQPTMVLAAAPTQMQALMQATDMHHELRLAADSKA